MSTNYYLKINKKNEKEIKEYSAKLLARMLNLMSPYEKLNKIRDVLKDPNNKTLYLVNSTTKIFGCDIMGLFNANPDLWNNYKEYYEIDDKCHIGKMSAAGPYCKDCHTTLCMEGLVGVHTSLAWHNKCPKCGKEVNTTSTSFTWQWEKGFWDNFFMENKNEKIIDECDKEYTVKEFIKILPSADMQKNEFYFFL